MNQKILISRCLLGDNVRYDGGHCQLSHPILEDWHHRWVPLCPEVAGGLSTPRPPAEAQSNHQIITVTGHDVSAAFQQGAQAALALCQQHSIRFALLKESSPSCGSQQIYDGSFRGRQQAGEGATTALLRQHGIDVFSEQQIDALIAAVSSDA